MQKKLKTKVKLKVKPKVKLKVKLKEKVDIVDIIIQDPIIDVPNQQKFGLLVIFYK